jgi:glycosyltransferase involved in cell wall biosynthesis
VVTARTCLIDTTFRTATYSILLNFGRTKITSDCYWPRNYCAINTIFFFPLVFVGADKGNYQYIRELADELAISAQIYFLGFVPQEDLISLYRKAFAIAYVTFFGPENLPPLEAFALVLSCHCIEC